MRISGIHHVTAIAGDPQRNLDFYTRVLGLRLVKKTVNFDDPGTYHFYFGDALGRPGTILTFFPWRGAVAGRGGAGMVSATAFTIPRGSLGFWLERLVSSGVDHRLVEDDRGKSISFADHDGLPLRLVADAESTASSGVWSEMEVPEEHAIRAFHGVTLKVRDPERSAQLLTEIFGFEDSSMSDESLRLVAGGESPGRIIQIERAAEPGRGGRGTVHHVAFRAASDDEQAAWREQLLEAGYEVTPVRDRQYFRSVYFREPGGVLYEIATDEPGFTLDESVDHLGEELKLPRWLEPRRMSIEASLPELAI